MLITEYRLLDNVLLLYLQLYWCSLNGRLYETRTEVMRRSFFLALMKSRNSLVIGKWNVDHQRLCRSHYQPFWSCHQSLWYFNKNTLKKIICLHYGDILAIRVYYKVCNLEKNSSKKIWVTEKYDQTKNKFQQDPVPNPIT